MSEDNTYSHMPPVDPAAQKNTKWIAAIIVSAILALVLGALLGITINNWQKPATLLNYSDLDEVYKVLKENYDGEIDDTKLLEAARRGMVDGVEDEYTQYFSEEESRDFYDALEGSFEGIGAELMNKNGKLTIISVLDDTPAQKVGLKADDVISKVDDEEVITWSADSAVQKIRGEAGTTVHLVVLRDDETLEFDITRAKITNPSVQYEIKDNIGYLTISRFSESDTSQLARTAAKAFVDADVKGVILDLRGNGGGYVSTAVDIASLWLNRGTTIVTEKTGNIIQSQETATGNNILRNIPTIVLIDGASASASEIVAGALSDGGKATLLGTRSYGKGSVQVMKDLRGGAQLKVTIARWYTPNDKNIDKEGIIPEIEVEFDDKAYKADGTDNQVLEAAKTLKNLTSN